MEIIGKIIRDLGLQQGTSKAGNPWKKREWVLETFDQYPKRVKFHIFGDRADSIILELGKDYTLYFDLESREWNDKWFTDVSVYRAVPYAANLDISNDVNPVPFNQPENGPFPGAGSAPYNNTNIGSGYSQVPNENLDPFNGGSDENLPF